MKTFPDDSTKFQDFAANTISLLPLRSKTKATYLSVCKNHLFPILGDKKLQSIRREEIQAVISSLPPQTAAMTLAVLKCLYGEAKSRSLLDISPAHGVSGPRIMIAPRKFMTWEQINESDFGRYTVQVRFLALHGLRWSEAVALTPEDISDGRILISKSIHGPTKSRAGIRTVPLVSVFKPLPKSPKTLNRVLKPYSVSIHSLRHSYAYLLKQQGVHVTKVQRLLGHADPRVTMNIYTQVLDSEIDETGDLLRKAIAR